VLENLVDKIEKLSVANKPEITQPQPADAAGAAASDKPKIRASKLEYKQVNKVYATCSAPKVLLTPSCKDGIKLLPNTRL
jgi:hypothetical protein